MTGQPGLPGLASMPPAVRRAAEMHAATRDAAAVIDRWTPPAAAIAEVAVRAQRQGPPLVAVRLVDRDAAAAMAAAIRLQLAEESSDTYTLWTGYAALRGASGERWRPVTITWSAVLDTTAADPAAAVAGTAPAQGRHALRGVS